MVRKHAENVLPFSPFCSTRGSALRLSAPFSKLLLAELPPAMLAALLYLGAGLGMFLLGTLNRRIQKERKDSQLGRPELPYIIGMIWLILLPRCC